MPDMTAGERVVIFVICNFSVPVVLRNTTARVSDIEWRLISAINILISVSPKWLKVSNCFRQTELCLANGESGDRQR